MSIAYKQSVIDSGPGIVG